MKTKQTKSKKSIKSRRPAKNAMSVNMTPAKTGKPAGATPLPSKNLPITVSNPTKVFWPDEGYTKLQLIEFYADIFPKLQPYVKDRILSLERCPDGMRGGCFYQKEAPSSLPPGTPTKRIAHVGKSAKSTKLRRRRLSRHATCVGQSRLHRCSRIRKPRLFLAQTRLGLFRYGSAIREIQRRRARRLAAQRSSRCLEARILSQNFRQPRPPRFYSH